jgi:molybdopterin/thiamine biosynthesis adenylyltransferase
MNYSNNILTNATTTHNLTYRITEDNKNNVPDELVGDVFDRQRVIVNHDQLLLESQNVLLLGCGGIGNNIAMALCRLGISTLFIVDRDKVDPSNLNRQILFNLNQISQSKAVAAKETLDKQHNLRSTIHAYHLDAVSSWSEIVKLASVSTVIFNTIDYGSVFDYSVNSLCKSLGIIYIAGSTYCNTIQTEFYSGLKNSSCWACDNNCTNSFKYTPAQLNNSNTIKNKSSNTHDLSYEISLTAKDIMDLFTELNCVGASSQCNQIIEQSLAALKVDKLNIDQFQSQFLPLYSKSILSLLSPQSILSHGSIQFIPKDLAVITRSVGSSVIVATTGAMLLVNNWLKYLFQSHSSNSDNSKTTVMNWGEMNLSLSEGNYHSVGYQTAQEHNCLICNNNISAK